MTGGNARTGQYPHLNGYEVVIGLVSVGDPDPAAQEPLPKEVEQGAVQAERVVPAFGVSVYRATQQEGRNMPLFMAQCKPSANQADAVHSF